MAKKQVNAMPTALAALAAAGQAKNLTSQIANMGMIGEVIVTGTAVTSISFSGLDGNADKGYRLDFEIVNPTGNGRSYKMFYNDDTTTTNYSDKLSTISVSLAVYPHNDAAVAECEATATAFGSIDINLNSDGLCYAMSRFIRKTGFSNDCYIQRKNTTITNLTKIDITADGAGAIGIGSKFRIYRRGSDE